MWKIRPPHHIVDSQHVEQFDADLVALIGRLALTVPVIGRLHRQGQIRELLLPLQIHMIQDVRNPADTALADHDLDVGISLQNTAIDDFHQDSRHAELEPGDMRSEERSVGKEGVSTWRSGWVPY